MTAVPPPLTVSHQPHSGFDWIALGAVALIFILITTAFWGETYDDVFLAYRYAKNIEAGQGFVFNPGERFLGTPAPLFVVLLVCGHALLPSLTIPQVGTLLGALGLTVTGYALFSIGRLHGQRILGALIALLAIFNPFSLLILGGESPLYLALVTSSFLTLARRSHAATGALLGLALMCRSEALIPITVVAGWFLINQRRIPRSYLVAIGCMALPWIVYASWEFGSPLSNSFSAKVAQVRSGRWTFPFGLARWLQTVVFGVNPFLLCSLVPAAIGIWVLAKSKSPFKLVALWGMAQTVAYCCLPIPFYHWYAAHLGVLGAVLVGTGAWAVCRPHLHVHSGARLTGLPALQLSQRPLFFTTVLCTVITLIACVKLTSAYNNSWPHAPANELYAKTGQWLKQHSPPDARIAYLEIGQIAFYSDRHIVDTLGLVTPGVAAHVAQRNWLWPIRNYKPDYIIFNPLFTSWPRSDQIFKESWFNEGFREETQISSPSYPATLTIYKRRAGAVIPD